MLTSILLVLAAAPCERVRPLPKRVVCEHKAGRVLEALELVEQHLAKKPRDKKMLKVRETLKAELVVFEWFSEPDGALLSVDGADPAGSTPLTVTLNPGPHTFHFTLDGCVPLDRAETAISGTRPKLTAVLDRVRAPEPEPAPEPAPTPEAAPAAAVTEPAPKPEPAAPAPATRSSAPYIVGVTGLVIAVGGGVLTFVSYFSLQNGGNPGAELRQYLGIGLAGVGVALGVAAIVWLLIDRPPGAPREPTSSASRSSRSSVW